MANLVQPLVDFVVENEFVNGIENAPEPLNLASQQLQESGIVNEMASLPTDSHIQFYAGPIRRIQPHRARKTAFGSHEVDAVIIEAIERAGEVFDHFFGYWLVVLMFYSYNSVFLNPIPA
jgi:hypothetical protein